MDFFPYSSLGDSSYRHYLDDFPDGLAQRLIIDVVAFLFVVCLAVWPPDVLVACGLVFEALPQPYEIDAVPLRKMASKIDYHRFYLALLPVVFSAYEVVTHGPLLPLFAVSFISHAVFLYHASRIIYFYLIWGREATGKNASFAKGLSAEEIEFINSLAFRPFYLHRISFSIYLFVDDRFFINEDRFHVKIWRMSDLKFTAIKSALNMQGDDWTTILVENLTTRQNFKFRILSSQLHRLQAFTTVEIKCTGMFDRFIERFTRYIDGNPKRIWKDTVSLEPCFACLTKQPDIIISKSCTDVDCGHCSCRPTWCATCMARVFAAAQPANRPGQWMDGTASCPTCRARFCPNDVLYLLDEANR